MELGETASWIIGEWEELNKLVSNKLNKRNKLWELNKRSPQQVAVMFWHFIVGYLIGGRGSLVVPFLELSWDKAASTTGFLVLLRAAVQTPRLFAPPPISSTLPPGVKCYRMCTKSVIPITRRPVCFFLSSLSLKIIQVENIRQCSNPMLDTLWPFPTSSPHNKSNAKVWSKCYLLEFHWPVVTFTHLTAQCRWSR